MGKRDGQILPILLGVLVAIAIAVILAITTGSHVWVDGNEYVAMFGNPNFLLVSIDKWVNFKNAAWIGLPIHGNEIVFGNVPDAKLAVSAIIAVVPIAIATMMEHIGDISAISATTERNFLADPGCFKRTLVGDGLATTLSALFGGPANTTYGENTGVLALTKVYDPKVVEIAAVFSILLSFSPKVAAGINACLPTGIIGGIFIRTLRNDFKYRYQKHGRK